MKKLIQPGNSKLNNTYMWNMPATKLQCGRICDGCYARREEARWPSVRKAREERYQASLQPNFGQRVIDEIAKLRKPPKFFRVHASSEFYSQDYISKWQQIAEAHPKITFYAYTKRMKDFDFSGLQSLPNFVLINSLHFGRLNYGKPEEAPTNAPVCPATVKATKDSTQCGVTCTACMQKSAETTGIWFNKH